MALLNHVTREITAKVVYYGPGLCGKTTNLSFIYENTEDEQRSKMLSLSTEADRTLFFDFLPMDLGTMRGFKVRVQLYTVPGQVFYEETRRRVLKGCDGVVFVADSQRRMAEANIEALQQLHQHLKDNGLRFQDVPLVLQYNKRDLDGLLTVEELDRDLNPDNAPFFEAIANEGIGVEDTLTAIMRLVLKNLLSKGAAPGQEAERPSDQETSLRAEAVFAEDAEPLFEAGETPELSAAGGTDPLFQEDRSGETQSMPFPESRRTPASPSARPPMGDPEWLFSEAGEETGTLLRQEDGLAALAEAPAVQEEPFRSAPVHPGIRALEQEFLRARDERPPEPAPAIEKPAVSQPTTSLHVPATGIAPSLRLKPGEPLLVTLDLGGRFYRLRIDLEPLPSDPDA